MEQTIAIKPKPKASSSSSSSDGGGVQPPRGGDPSSSQIVSVPANNKPRVSKKTPLGQTRFMSSVAYLHVLSFCFP
jgi:hypothetical protein